MISSTLQQAFFMLESSMFQTWQKADKDERKRIVRNLGRFEGEMILEEINKICNLKYKTLKNEKP